MQPPHCTRFPLTFSRATSEPVLREIDLKVSHGEKIALCGRTGRFVALDYHFLEAEKERTLIHYTAANRLCSRLCFEFLKQGVALYSLMAWTFPGCQGHTCDRELIPFPSNLSSSMAQYASTLIQKELPPITKLSSLFEWSISGPTSSPKAD